MMTLKELRTGIEVFFSHHPVFCITLLLAVVVVAYAFYMQVFQHDEVLKQTMDMCMLARSDKEYPMLNWTTYDACKSWVYQK